MENHLKVISNIRNIILSNFKEKNTSDYNHEIIYICLDILQKAVIRRRIFEAVLA